MYSLDQRLRGLPLHREQIVSVFQSINSPHLAIPGKQAGPAQAFIVGLRGSAGLAVFVYLFLAESADCAVYVPDRRNLGVEELPDQEQDALGFVESMGFIMDQLHFREAPKADQEELMRTLPVFQKEPRPTLRTPAATSPAGASSQEKLGRLFAAF